MAQVKILKEEPSKLKITFPYCPFYGEKILSAPSTIKHKPTLKEVVFYGSSKLIHG